MVQPVRIDHQRVGAAANKGTYQLAGFGRTTQPRADGEAVRFQGEGQQGVKCSRAEDPGCGFRKRCGHGFEGEGFEHRVEAFGGCERHPPGANPECRNGRQCGRSGFSRRAGHHHQVPGAPLVGVRGAPGQAGGGHGCRQQVVAGRDLLEKVRRDADVDHLSAPGCLDPRENRLADLGKTKGDGHARPHTGAEDLPAVCAQTR